MPNATQTIAVIGAGPTAVPELRAHAARVADVLLGQLSAQRQQRSIA